jgi:predicted O-methyltransferase YrrM
MNHFYKDIVGYFTWPKFYSDLAKELKSKGKTRGVELGTCNGQSLAYLAVELINLEADCVVDGVDITNGSGVAAANLATVRNVVRKLHSCLSWSAAVYYEDSSLDFVFIDAKHTYDCVKADIEAWRGKVKPGGIICGHDFSQAYKGLILAVTEAFESWEVHRGEKFEGLYYPVWSVRV